MPSFAHPTIDAPAFGPAARPASGAEYLNWRAIDASLLDEGRSAVPEFPLARLPRPWRDWVAATARSAGAPADYVAQALFAAVAGVCGAGVAAEVTPSWSEPLVLWQALLGGPSSGKSSALAAVRRLLVPIEDALRRDDDKRHGRHVARAEQASTFDRTLGNAVRPPSWARFRRPIRPPDSAADHDFFPARIMVEQTLVAALGDAVSANPRGVIVWRDRPSDWPAVLGGSARGRNEGRSERACWLEAWNAGETALERRSHGAPRRLARFAVSIIGSLHPDRLAEQLSGSEDGLAARLLFSWPDTPPYCSLESAILALTARRSRCCGASPARRARPTSRCRCASMTVRWTASTAFWQVSMSRSATPADSRRAGWAKAPARWSGWPLASHCSPGRAAPRSTVHPAMSAVRRSRMPLPCRPDISGRMPAPSSIAPAGDGSRAPRTSRGALAGGHGRAEVSRQEIRCEALGDTANAAEADQVIARLSKAGILRLHVILSSSSGGRPTRRWLVNPALRRRPMASANLRNLANLPNLELPYPRKPRKPRKPSDRSDCTEADSWEWKGPSGAGGREPDRPLAACRG